jgi:hypothetical protein
MAYKMGYIAGVQVGFCEVPKCLGLKKRFPIEILFLPSFDRDPSSLNYWYSIFVMLAYELDVEIRDILVSAFTVIENRSPFVGTSQLCLGISDFLPSTLRTIDLNYRIALSITLLYRLNC